MIFEYNNQYTPQNLIDIDSVGNVCIEGFNENEGFHYFLLIKTTLGNTSIFEYGPVVIDIDKLCDEYTVKFTRMKYNEKKLMGYIKSWLNDKHKGITEAKVVEEKDFVDCYKNILYNIEKGDY